MFSTVGNACHLEDGTEAPNFDLNPETDVLIVVDMQNDFLPADVAPSGGRFGVADGGAASRVICPLIHKFASEGCVVVATRDYHPIDHVSFNSQGGPFPPHCIQGSDGSKFFPEIAHTLQEARGAGGKVHVVFKGFFEDVDSFGAFPYPQTDIVSRLSHRGDQSSCMTWNGAIELKQSNIDSDINAPPDILSVLHKTTLDDLLLGESASRETKRLFICGLAFDFCVLDTALNAGAAGYEHIYILLDASRAAHIPGFGTHGSGFLTNPVEIKEKMENRGVKLISSSQIH